MFDLENIKKVRMIAVGENKLVGFVEKMQEINGDYMTVYVDDCFTEYYSRDKERVVETGGQLNFMINSSVDKEATKNAIKRRKKSEQNYLEFLYELAEAGISYYYISFGNTMCMFYDADDKLVYQEHIGREE